MNWAFAIILTAFTSHYFRLSHQKTKHFCICFTSSALRYKHYAISLKWNKILYAQNIKDERKKKENKNKTPFAKCDGFNI